VALSVLSAILFSPRGGSAPVARSLARGLRAQGCEVTLLAGSRGDLGGHGDARRFYGEADAVEFDAALASADPLRFEGPPGTAPMHPSFEERLGAPDLVFAMLDDLDYEHQVRAWSRELARAGAAEMDVLHLHHLTPLNEAAARVAPHVPIVGQLHGTELLMLEQIEEGPPPGWDHAQRWADRLRDWAQRCSRLIVAPAGAERASRLLGVPLERLTGMPNGVDVDLFKPGTLERRQFWQRTLVEDPRGWAPGQAAGSVRYATDDLALLENAAVFVYVGRFTAVKRLDRLLAAFALAQQRVPSSAALVLVGGHPGEWEREHPADTVARLGVPNVFLAGWRSHEELPDFFVAADAVISAAEREQFGQLLIEGMACGIPAIGIRALGPESIIEDGSSGWLVPAADEASLAATITEVTENPRERRRRGLAARESVCERFSWTQISAQLAGMLADAAESGHASAVEVSAAPAVEP
jgi:glycosyltransferase involved in cell wall biosynthesis